VDDEPPLFENLVSYLASSVAATLPPVVLDIGVGKSSGQYL